MDNLTFDQRVYTMRSVKGKNTKPEMIVRRLVHALGYRYRLHRRELPGCPDLVFHSRKKAIFVHGCFWHGHACSAGLNRPKSNTRYWTDKLRRNILRDYRHRARLRALGWKVLTIWECELKKMTKVQERTYRFLQ